MTYAELKKANLCVDCKKRERDGEKVRCALCGLRLSARGPVLHRPSVAGPFHVCCQASGFHRDGCTRSVA